jgi:hypothetical protein
MSNKNINILFNIYPIRKRIWFYLLKLLSNEPSTLNKNDMKFKLSSLVANDCFINNPACNHISILYNMNHEYYKITEDNVINFINKHYIGNKSLLKIDYERNKSLIISLVMPKYIDIAIINGESLLSIDTNSLFTIMLNDKLALLEDLEETKIYIKVTLGDTNIINDEQRQIVNQFTNEYNNWLETNVQNLKNLQCKTSYNFYQPFNTFNACIKFKINKKRYNIEFGIKEIYHYINDNEHNLCQLCYVYCEKSMYFSYKFINHECSELYQKNYFIRRKSRHK